jgi:hypothetical protein
MTATREEAPAATDDATRDCTLVWIDSRRAVVAHWHDGEANLEHLESDVPSHHRATGHVRYDPSVRHGGGAPQDTGEANRLEHLARFVDLVAGRVPPGDDLVIIGPGTVRDRLEHRVREADRHASRTRIVTCQAAGRLTDRQLLARLRHVAGADERRRSVGAYRWTEPSDRRRSGGSQPTPRRVAPKPSTEIDEEDLLEEIPG